MARDFLGSMGIITHPKVKRFCYDNEDPYDAELKAMMGFKEELNELSPAQLRSYRSQFKKDCEKIVGDYVSRRYLHKKGLMTASEFKEFLKQTALDFFEKYDVKRSNWHSNIYITNFINGLLKIFELSGSQLRWVLFSQQGLRVSELFIVGNKMQKTYAAAILFTYFYYAYINSSYDEIIFRETLFSALPDMRILLSEYNPISAIAIKFFASNIGAISFLKGVRLIMQKQFNLPDEFFDKFTEPKDFSKDLPNVKNPRIMNNNNIASIHKKSIRKGKKGKKSK